MGGVGGLVLLRGVEAPLGRRGPGNEGLATVMEAGEVGARTMVVGVELGDCGGINTKVGLGSETGSSEDSVSLAPAAGINSHARLCGVLRVWQFSLQRILDLPIIVNIGCSYLRHEYQG